MIQFDVNKIVEENISPRLRKVFTFTFLKVCASPLLELYASFYQFYNDKKYELLFNGQVIYLEHLLNDQFDDVNRDIYITDSPQQSDPVVLFNQDENNEKTILYNQSEGELPVILYNKNEIDTWPSFIVNVPAGVVFNEERLKAYVNKYKLASKKYIIKIV